MVRMPRFVDLRSLRVAELHFALSGDCLPAAVEFGCRYPSVAQNLSSMCYDLMRLQFALHLQAPVLTFGNPSAPHRFGDALIGE